MQHLLTIIPSGEILGFLDSEGNNLIHHAVRLESWACFLVLINFLGATPELLAL